MSKHKRDDGDAVVRVHTDLLREGNHYSVVVSADGFTDKALALKLGEYVQREILGAIDRFARAS